MKLKNFHIGKGKKADDWSDDDSKPATKHDSEDEDKKSKKGIITVLKI